MCEVYGDMLDKDLLRCGVILHDMEKINEIESDENQPVFKLFVAQGSENNLKPEFVIEKFYEYMNLPFDVLDFYIHRNDIYTKVDDKFVSLNDVGEEIV